MAIALRGTATTGSTTITAPTGTANGDVLFVVAISPSGTTITVPTGWTTVRNITTSSGSTLRLVVAYLAWTTGSSTTWTITGATFNVCSGYSGLSNTSPLIVENYATTSASGTITTPSVSNTDPAAWRIAGWAAAEATFSAMSAWTTFSPADSKRNASNNTQYALALTDSNAAIATGSTSITGTCPDQYTTYESAAAWIGILAPLSTIVATDSGSGVDTASVSAGSDISTSTDTGSVTATASAADTVLAADTATVTAVVGNSDTASAFDLAIASQPIAASDLGNATESAFLSIRVTSIDSAIATESANITATVTTSEASLGQDTGAVVASIPASDTGLGIESPFPVIDVFDSVVATDSALALLTLSDTDSASGTDQAAMSAAAQDTMAARDTATVTAVISVVETGTAADYTHNYWYSSDLGTGADVAIAMPNGTDMASGAESGSVTALITAADRGFAFDLVPLGQPGVALHGVRVVTMAAEARRVLIDPESRSVRVPRDLRASAPKA